MKQFSDSRAYYLGIFFVSCFIGLTISTAVSAQAPPRLGGHFGVVFPIVTRSDGRTITIADDFAVGFPMGITIRNSSPFAFDFEFIPTINRSPRQDVTLTVHPGVIYSFEKNYGVGIRAAFDVGADAYGFTPLVQRSWKIKGDPSFSSKRISRYAFDRNLTGAEQSPLRSAHISASHSNHRAINARTNLAS